eukprot:Clim_evm3s141 gene=Clim_evmTU3s141
MDPPQHIRLTEPRLSDALDTPPPPERLRQVESPIDPPQTPGAPMVPHQSHQKHHYALRATNSESNLDVSIDPQFRNSMGAMTLESDSLKTDDVVRAEDFDDSDGSSTDTENMSDDEDEEDYKKGGYHPVNEGETYGGSYKTITKLGWGQFSTVWLAKDLGKERFAALKIVKSAEHYTEAALDEIRLLRTMRNCDPKDPGRQHVVQMYNDFRIKGPHGQHICMVFEVLGKNLLSLIKKYKYRGVPLPLVKNITYQVLQGLDYMHRKCSIIHTDIKPENVLMAMTTDEIDALATEAATLHESTSNLKAASDIDLRVEKELDENYADKRLTKNQLNRVRQKLRRKIERDLYDQQAQSMRRLSSLSVSNLGTIGENSPPLGKPGERSGSSDNGQVPRGSGSVGSIPQLAAANPGEPITERVSAEFMAPLLSRRPSRRSASSSSLLRIAQSFECDVKIADLGNACWITHHFTDDIQTRQYRSPEVILGAGYNETADIWSLACMVFELVTGEFLFEPYSGRNYTRDEDHLAQIMELLGKMPRHLIVGKYARDFFNRRYELRNIKELKFFKLYDVLVEKYGMEESEAQALTEFLLPMLDMNPERRQSAQDALQSPWLAEARDRGDHSENGSGRGSGGRSSLSK